MNALVEYFLGFVRPRPFIAGCLAFTLVLGAANFFLWQGYQAAALKHEEVKQQGEMALRTLANRPRIDSDLAALRTANGYLEKNLLDEQSMEVNLGYFYRLEKTTHVRLVRLNQLAAPVPTPGSAFKTVQFSLQAKGTYRNNVNFLRALETGPRILRLRNCSFERGATDSADLLLDLTVDMLAKP